MDIKRLGYVSERDVDLLLLEELNVSPEFCRWFFDQLAVSNAGSPDCLGAWHSVSDSKLGEADLVVIYENGFAVLVENKIDAPAQPEQAERYRLRGKQGCDRGVWSEFLACIVAPERYLRGNGEASKYDRQISYEVLEEYFTSHGSRRSEYRAGVLRDAIEQNRRGYSPQADEAVTDFWLSYWEVVNDVYPELNMTQPKIKPAKSDWPTFKPARFARKMDIVHKMAQGYVDLQVRGAAGRLEEMMTLVKDEEVEIVAAGKSAAIRIAVPAVDRFSPFEAQRDSIFVALEAAEQLLQIGNDITDFD